MHKEFIHQILGTHFWVDESRVEEYKAAGHKLVEEQKAQEPEKPSVKTASKESKKTAKKG